MNEAPTLSPAEIIDALRRRSGWLVLTFLVVTTIAVGIALVLKPTFTATARILVESPQISPELAQSTVTASTAQRLTLIEERLMARESLLSLAEQIDYPGEPASDNAIVGSLRKATSIESVLLDSSRRGRSSGELAAFTISFTSTEPERAARIANALMERVLQQNQRSRGMRAEQTRAFFADAVRRHSAELADIESQITTYKSENKGGLPDDLEFLRNELSNLEARAFERKRTMLELQKQRRALEDRLLQKQVSPQPPALGQEELKRLQRQLREKQSIFADSHPQVRSLLQQISLLEAELAKAVQDPAALQDGAAESKYVTTQIETVDGQIAFLQEEAAAADERIHELSAAVEAAPRVEMELARLLRRHEKAKSEYDSASRKLIEAETGERLERTGQSERFEIIEEAQVPEGSDGPSRKIVVAGGAFLGILAGLAVVFLLELADPRIYSAAQLERRLGLRPFMTVPRMS